MCAPDLHVDGAPSSEPTEGGGIGREAVHVRAMPPVGLGKER